MYFEKLHIQYLMAISPKKFYIARDFLIEKMSIDENELNKINELHSEYYVLVIKEAAKFIENRNYKDAFVLLRP